jgi:NAD(P)-dependent dehydrogenase (short-subunit alcohol dehydrogenase family)
MRFKDQVVVITGAGRGMGKAMALAYAREGASLALAARRHNEVLATVTECAAFGAKAVALTTDVADSAAVEKLAEHAQAHFGRIDVWVNNAGIWGMGAIDALTDAQWAEMLAINLSGVFFGTRAAAQRMKPNGKGSILNVASVSSQLGTAKSAHYSASKYGVIGLTEAAAADLREFSITVNAICPGATSHKDFSPADGAPGPLARILTPVEIAPMALFLTSAEAKMITGAAIDVFGGTQFKIS